MKLECDMKCAVFVFVVAMTATSFAQTTRPVPRSTESTNPDQMLRQLLSPARPSAKPLEPVEFPREDTTSKTAVAPKVDSQNLIREGSFINDRIGRLTKTPEGQQELTF